MLSNQLHRTFCFSSPIVQVLKWYFIYFSHQSSHFVQFLQLLQWLATLTVFHWLLFLLCNLHGFACSVSWLLYIFPKRWNRGTTYVSLFKHIVALELFQQPLSSFRIMLSRKFHLAWQASTSVVQVSCGRVAEFHTSDHLWKMLNAV